MASESSFSWASFARAALLPSVWVLVLPILGLWFTSHVESSWDADFGARVRAEIAEDSRLSDAERAQADAAWSELRFSALCADDSPETAAARADLAALCGDYQQIRWIKQASQASILLSLLTAVALGALAGLAFVGREAQYVALQAGWTWLQLASAAQVATQGLVAIGLSFWVTAFWFERFSVKLIFVIGALVLFGAFALIKSIFHRPDLSLPVVGKLILPTDAPALWERVMELARVTGTRPPDRIIGGIDDNFFVTEAPVILSGERLEGRTLFVSLSLLRALSLEEADAVLAHEMAHFSGNDTGWSRRFAPLRARYHATMLALLEGPTRPIGWPMVAFWSLLDLASSRQSRERELRADAIAARHTSPRGIAASLVKVAAWSQVRGKVQEALFAQDQRLTEVGIAARVRSQFDDYAQSPALIGEIEAGDIPHPFDSHPSIAERTRAVGADLPPERWRELLLERPASTWVDHIPVADAIEGELWTAFEQAFAQHHEFNLACRYRPNTEEERALVLKHFPAIELHNKDGAFVLSYEGLRHDAWAEPCRFEDIASMSVQESTFSGNYLEIVPTATAPWAGKRSLSFKGLSAPQEAFLERLNLYYGRHQHAHRGL